METKKQPSPLSLQYAGKAWTMPETSNKVMDEKLAFAFAEILDEILSKAWLGNATTKELLKELTSRAEVGGYSNYKTSDNY